VITSVGNRNPANADRSTWERTARGRRTHSASQQPRPSPRGVDGRQQSRRGRSWSVEGPAAADARAQTLPLRRTNRCRLCLRPESPARPLRTRHRRLTAAPAGDSIHRTGTGHVTSSSSSPDAGPRHAERNRPRPARSSSPADDADVLEEVRGRRRAGADEAIREAAPRRSAGIGWETARSSPYPRREAVDSG
jgi:hypothetical protein